MIKVRKILRSREVTFKDGTKRTKTEFLTDSDDLLDTFGTIEEGKEYEGTIKEDEFGKHFQKARTGGAMRPAYVDPEYLEKKNELNARQTALNAAVTFAAAKIEAGEKDIDGEAVLKMAEINLEWLKGKKMGAKSKEKEVDEEIEGYLDKEAPDLNEPPVEEDLVGLS